MNKVHNFQDNNSQWEITAEKGALDTLLSITVKTIINILIRLIFIKIPIKISQLHGIWANNISFYH